ncbi:hypothetical protein NDU88_002296 [Pleurodeles waltl]|uniref:Myb/SANT-like DNA-binding domain-containing protein n=1 Tax=Pleurodeles waltl TaxID=8319 RepID=A0AAV7R9L2_PLEWA|nr:hypothetical protein NDU88_002296 [Pleurodeles waltl]
MACVAGERAPAFTNEELEKLVHGVLPLYAKLYGRPEVQVSTHQKRGLWHAIAKEVRTLGALQPSEHSLQEEVGGPMALGEEDLAGEVLPKGKGCPSGTDPPHATHPVGGVPGPGWALQGCTAVTRGLRYLPSLSSLAVSVVEVYGKKQGWHDLQLSLMSASACCVGLHVCKADTENRDGCHCTRRTPSTPPAPFGAGFLGRPPAQRESQNGRRGHLTAVRSFGGSRRAGGYRRRWESE